jgi:hypothetical protein
MAKLKLWDLERRPQGRVHFHLIISRVHLSTPLSLFMSPLMTCLAQWLSVFSTEKIFLFLPSYTVLQKDVTMHRPYSWGWEQAHEYGLKEAVSIQIICNPLQGRFVFSPSFVYLSENLFISVQIY